MLQKITSWLLYVLMGLALVAAALLYAGGFEDAPLNSRPIFTDQILFLAYAFVGIAVASTLLVSLVNFVRNAMLEPKAALKALVGPVLMIGVVIVAYFMADDTALNIIGYDGPDNIPSMLKLADVCLYTTYFLIAFSILLVVVTSVINIFK